MPTTTANAIDEMFAIIRAAAITISPTLHIEWEGVGNNTPPPQTAEWIRASCAHDPEASYQATLSCEHDQRRWRREGQLFVQCFAPLKAGGLPRALAMASTFRDALQSSATPGGVWFRRVGAREVGAHNSLYQANTSARFQYDEVK